MFGQLPLIYLKKIKASKELKLMEYKVEFFSFCSFMCCIYIIGCWFNDYKDTDKCYKYNTITNNWYKIANKNFKRYETTCSVFEGKIVVTGDGYVKYMKSVEAYDHHENKWIILPNMIKSRKKHTSIVIGNKLFVV